MPPLSTASVRRAHFRAHRANGLTTQVSESNAAVFTRQLVESLQVSFLLCDWRKGTEPSAWQKVNRNHLCEPLASVASRQASHSQPSAQWSGTRFQGWVERCPWPHMVLMAPVFPERMDKKVLIQLQDLYWRLCG